MSAPTPFVSVLGPVIERHVAFQRALGCRYDLPHRLLGQFDRFLASRRASDLTAESYAAWCASIEHLTANGRRLRMQIVHQLCTYRRRGEPGCFVPDPTQFPPRQPAARPHIFSEAEVVRVLGAADGLRPDEHSPLHPRVARIAVVLLYTAGLRRSEVARLTLGDYDLAERALLVRESKFHKSRLIPLSCDAVSEMERFLDTRRRRPFPRAADASLLIHFRRGFLGYTDFSFSQLVKRTLRVSGVRTAVGRVPRVHDLRFTFAIHALLRWYRAGVDVQSRLPALATFMGHNTVESTFYYLPYFEEVAQLAAERFDRHCSRFLGVAAPMGGAR
jgi:integrase/recombinase XerD